MVFHFSETELAGIVLIEPRVYPDDRGFFTEIYKRSEFAANGISEVFLQVNCTRSSRGVLRGLHYQKAPKAQAKLIRCIGGEIFDVVVDIRPASPTYGRWLGIMLSANRHDTLYVPTGFAHGFCVTGESAEIMYMTTEEYAPAYEGGVIWNDPDLAIHWPVAEPQLSPRDQNWPRLRDAENNPRYSGEVDG